LLLVDSDARSLRVLEVSLKKAGYGVATATSASRALEFALETHPDLVITDTVLPDSDGFDLCHRIKSDPRLARTSVLFLSAETSADARVKGINAGADDYVSKPVLVMEIVQRVRGLLERRETEAITRRDRAGNLSGALANMGVVDLLQLMESGQKSGIVYLASDRERSGGFVAGGEQRATIFFRDGRVIDAHLAKLNGPAAVYRMLMWEDGVFEIEFKPLAREDVVHTSTQALLLEGMRRIDEWSRLRELLPEMDTKLSVDFGSLSARYKDVPEEVRSVLHLFDGRRSIFEVVHEASLDDTEILGTIAELYRSNVLRVGEAKSAIPSAPISHAAQASSPDLDTWLSSGPRSSELPSVLGRAMIPSPNTASEILSAASPLDRDDREDPTLSDAPIPLTHPVRERTPVPEPIPEDSQILSRHTVPANKPVLLTQASKVPAASEPIPLTQPSKAPQRLAIQRVASVVAARPRSGSTITQLSSIASNTPNVPTDTMPPAKPDVWAETARKLQHDETERVIRTVVPAATKSSETGERVPARSASLIVAATQTQAPHVPAPVIPAPIAAPIIPAPVLAAALPATNGHIQREQSGLHDSFFEKKNDDDALTWEPSPGGRWKGLVLIAALLGAAAGVVFIPRLVKQKHEVAPLPVSAKKDAEKKQAAWPAADDTKVEFEGTQPEGIAEQPVGEKKPEAVVRPVVDEKKPDAVAVQPEVAKPEVAKQGAPLTPAIDPAATLAKAEAALKGDKLKDADKQFRSVIEAQPNNATAHSGLALVLYSMERDAQAAAAARKALSLEASSARAHLVLGLVASNKLDIVAAKKSYQRYLELEPKGEYASEVRRFMQAQQ
jgi:CheY-like chemotaxis protein